MRRALLLSLAIAFALACGDNVTEPIPDRTATVDKPLFATTTTEDGLSISTDKDDYTPGDTVHLTGAGWPANDVLDIRLDDEPATHEPHTWTIDVAEDGTFHDTTYVVDVGDLGVTFTLTATSREDGRSITVVFTDGQLRLISPTVPAGLLSVPFSPGALQLFVQNPTTGSPSGTHTNVTISIRQGQSNLNPTPPPLVKTLPVAASMNESNTATSSATWNGTEDPTNAAVAEGLYMARAFSTQTPEDDNGNRKLPIVVDRTAPAVSLVALSASEITAGQSLAITLTARATDPIATGATAGHYRIESAQFNRDGGSFAAMAAQDGSFSSQIEDLTTTIDAATIAGLSPGLHTFCVKATDAAGNASSSTAHCAALQVNAASVATTTEVTSSANPSVSGQSVTFTATVKSGGTAIGANGAVSFRQGGTDCTTGTEVQAATSLDANGQATYNASFNASGGSQVIRACYGGATGYNASNGSITQNVNKAETSVGVTKDPTGNSVFGQSVTFNVTVSVSSPGSGTPTGSVTFEKGGTACGTGTEVLSTGSLNASSQASFSTASLGVGTHTIRACYAGDLDFNGNGNSIQHTVEKAATTTTITSTSPSGSQYVNGPVTVNFSVAVQAPGSGTPTGTVDVKNGATVLCSASLPATSCQFTPTVVEVLSLVASYVGDGNFLGSSSGITYYTIKYRFDGLYAPVDRPNTMNVSKAGQAVPLKWRLTDYSGNPILTLSTVTVKVMDAACALGITTDQLEEYAAGSSGLQNLGDGNYQFNWKTPTTYASSCKQISLVFVPAVPGGAPAYAEGPLAYFTFKR